MESSTSHNSSSSSSSDNEDDTEEATDAFLVSVESKLRSNFSSLELCKSIQIQSRAQRANAEHSNVSLRRNLRLLSKTFEEMSKPIKLRVLISLMCLDSFLFTGKKAKVENAINDIIKAAEGDDDEWVKILAGVVKGTIYVNDCDENDSINTNISKNKVPCNSNRGKGAEKLFEKTCNSILKQIQNHATAVNALAEDIAVTDGQNGTTDLNQDHENDIRVDRAVADLAPLFAPLRFSLLSPTHLEEILPESFDNDHFVTNNDAHILKIDEAEEKLRADEERKEMEQKLEQERRLEEMKKKKQLLKPKSLGISKVGKTNMTPREKIMASRRPAVRGRNIKGRGGTMLGRGGSMPGRGGNMLGRGKRGLDSVGSSFMRAPTRPTAGKSSLGRGTVSNMGRNLQSKTSATSLSSNPRGGRAMKNSRSKMKMIDVSEVKDLSEEQKKNEEEERRNAKRRKIREMSGIKRSSGGWSGGAKKKKMIEKHVNKVADTQPPVSLNEEIINESMKHETIPNENTLTLPPTSQTNISGSNPLLGPQENALSGFGNFPVNQDSHVPQNMVDPVAIHMQDAFNQGQLLHEHHHHQQQQLQTQQNQFIHNDVNDNHPHQQYQFNDQLEQQSQIQYQQFPLNDALMHLQPQYYDHSIPNLDSNNNSKGR